MINLPYEERSGYGLSAAADSLLNHSPTLSTLRYSEAGQTFDLERIFLGGHMLVSAKRRCTRLHAAPA